MQKLILSRIGGYIIRQCTSEDIPAVISINMRTLPEHYSDYFYYEVLSEFPETFLVAEIGNEIVGYIMCRIEYGFSNLRRFGLAKKGHIISVAVLEEHRGKGIGTKLIELALKEMARKGCKECVKGDAVLLGDNIAISRIKVGGSVLGITGKERILGKNSQYYNGYIMKIVANGLLPIEVTPNHPILTLSRCSSNKADGSLEWKLSRHILPVGTDGYGDYLVVPRIRSNTKRLDSIGKGSLSREDMQILARFAGLYLSIGNIAGGKVQFIKKDKIIKVIDREFSRISSIDRTARLREKGEKVEIEMANSYTLWLRRFGSNEINKEIPDEIMLSTDHDLLTNLLSGWEDGIKVDNFKGLSSRVLALQIQLLYLRLGRFIGIRERGNLYELDYSLENEPPRAIVGDEFALIPVINVSFNRYRGRVYNIETEDDTYLLSNAVVHNCYLEVRVSNKRAISLYQKLNYRIVGRLEGYYRDGEAAYLMAVPIES